MVAPVSRTSNDIMEFFHSWPAWFFSAHRVKRCVHFEKGNSLLPRAPSRPLTPVLSHFSVNPIISARPCAHSFCCPEKPPVLLLTWSFAQTTRSDGEARRTPLPTELESDDSLLFFQYYLFKAQPAAVGAQRRAERVKWRRKCTQISLLLIVSRQSQCVRVMQAWRKQYQRCEFGLRDDKPSDSRWGSFHSGATDAVPTGYRTSRLRACCKNSTTKIQFLSNLVQSLSIFIGNSLTHKLKLRPAGPLCHYIWPARPIRNHYESCWLAAIIQQR